MKYGTQLTAPALFPFPPNNSFLVFNAEALTAGEYSQQVALPPGPTSDVKGLRGVIDFNQNPGNVEIYVCEADNDATGSPLNWSSPVRGWPPIKAVTMAVVMIASKPLRASIVSLRAFVFTGDLGRL